MKKGLITIIGIYQKLISSFLHQALGVKNACRFSPTCSEYAKNSIAKYGVLKGTQLSVVRILKCQPFYKGN